MILRAVFAMTLVSSSVFGRVSVPSGLLPVNLRCEYANDPIGVDNPAPRLFWTLESSERAQIQSAYRILAATTPTLLERGKGDLWDSGKVDSAETVQIRYGGKPLGSSQEIFWKVRVWDKQGRAVWSQPAAWTMGVLSEQDWRAKWITAPALSGPKTEALEKARTNYQTILLRKEFTVKPGLKRAIVHVCGLGQYEMSFNGRNASDILITPGWTKYDKTCLYDSLDVTALLKTGPNAAGLILGNGMYNVQGGRYAKFTGSFGPPKAIAQLVLDYGDGRMETVGTDETWSVSPGPIIFSCVFGGEDYDARLEPRGWTESGFSGQSWNTAAVIAGPGGKLRGLSCAASPIKAIETIAPVSRRTIRSELTVYDLGQNAPIMPRLKVSGPAGAVIRITPAELLTKEGTVDRGSCGGGQAYWQYTCAGTGNESWFPKFFYHGCRYLQVECMPLPSGEIATVDSLEGVVVHASSPEAGQFECSNELFNRIRTLIRWAQRSNMMSIMTDCPHREKLSWLEEDHLNGPSLRYEFDLARLFSKITNDMMDSQRENGLVPDIAPEYVVFQGGFLDSPEWGSACVQVPWQQYEFHGDVELLRRSYEMMKRYVVYLQTRSSNHIVSHGLGDWYDLGPNPPGVAQLTPLPVTATAFYYHDTWVLSQAAALLGKVDDARQYSQKAAEIRQAFNKAFFHQDTAQYATGSQCANAIPLVMGIAEPQHRAAVMENIVHDIRNRGNALTPGDVGYRFLLRALANGGRSDVIFDINNQSEKPGYGFQLKAGATSLTEAWDSGRGSSQNHFMLGQIMEWFYRDLAGISPDPAAPGFKNISIRPTPVGDVTWARASYASVRGRIYVEWRREDAKFSLKLGVPANTTATVFLPTKTRTTVSESGKPADSASGVTFVCEETGRAVYSIGSGQYHFQADL